MKEEKKKRKHEQTLYDTIMHFYADLKRESYSNWYNFEWAITAMHGELSPKKWQILNTTPLVMDFFPTVTSILPPLFPDWFFAVKIFW